MQITTKKISELIPAEYNPRVDLKPGNALYEKLKSSIQEFGYIEPIIWNERTGHVVGGHQRLKILQELGLKEAECVIVNFSEAQEKAANIALNKISNKWDMDKLIDLFQDLQDTQEINLELTGFNMPELDKILKVDFSHYYGDEREKTYDAYRLNEYDEIRTAGYYQFPTIKACHVVPDDLIGFNYARSYKGDKSKVGIHFFIDDYQFERVWNNPFENIEILREYQCAIMPDFSTYFDMPIAMRIWNVYRMRMIGQIMQDAGLEVIPNIRDFDIHAGEANLEGIEPGGVIAISTVGYFGKNSTEEIRRLYKEFSSLTVKVLQPELIISYGKKWPDYDYDGAKVKYISTKSFAKNI